MSVKITGTTSSPRSISIENDLIRLEYPTLSAQKGSHTLFYKPGGAGGDKIHDDGTYSDYTYYVNTVTTEPTACTVITNSSTKAEVTFKYTINGFTLTAHDAYNNAIYTNGAVLRTHTSLTLYKTIKVLEGYSGYFVGYHSDPMLWSGSIANTSTTDTGSGEHEIGFGLVSTVAFSSNNVTALNPEANAHTDMLTSSQTVGPWWAAAIHARKNYLCYISIPHPFKIDDYQFNAPDKGTLVCHYINPWFNTDIGQVERYQCFLGVTPYTMTTRGSEPTQAAKDVINREIAKIDWSKHLY